MSEPLYDRMMALAIDLSFASGATQDRLDALAMRASELANEVRDSYVSLDPDGPTPTNAQGLALARTMRGRWANGVEDSVSVYREVGFGERSPRIGFHFIDGYAGGIGPDGSVNT